MDIIELLYLARSKGASDLHLVCSRPPILRINGVLQPLDDLPDLTNAAIETAFSQIASFEEREVFKKSLELDFSYSMPHVMRLRCSASRQRKTISLALRLIPWMIPTFEELYLPEICKHLVTRPRGMVVISGPTGSGKTTTLAAMIDYLNNNENLRVETVEDPIEYVYLDNKCTITQRQIGVDTLSFADSLKHVLRHDPDVVLVGELRDGETAAAALNLAETGHLVLTTGHAPGAAETIDRIINLFPPTDRFLAQTRIASLLIGVVCQTLVPTVSNRGRIPAVEVMLANPAIKNLIREGKIYQLDNTIRSNTQSGMVLMDHSLVDLYKRKQISIDMLLSLCNDRSEVDRLMGDVLVKS
jgi:twitching motility protein PilT